ncbi:hypothetical protein SH449x_000238 [Pirellulaceae bacterium SH449]
MRLVTMLCLASFLVVGYLEPAFGLQAPDAEKDGKPKVEMLTLQVLVKDPDGHPIENATVFPSGLRTKAEPSSHWGWREELFGLLPKMQTSAEGLVDLPYPKYMTEKLEVGTVTISVEHPDFVTFREDRSVDDAPAEVPLKIGFRIAATAVDANSGEPIKTDLYGLVSGDTRMSDWKLAENGMLVSPVYESNKTWFRMMKIVPGEPTLFSELIEIDPADRSRVLLRNIKLAVGTRVEGKLDDSVTRPVKNGIVSAAINRRGSDGRRFNWFSTWRWLDKTIIAEDGTFVFESMPTDEVLQLIPICDGWVPKPPTKEDVLPFFPDMAERLGVFVAYPQLFRSRGPQIEPTLKMIPATSVKVTVVDRNNKPLPGVEVASRPYQYWFDGGSQILGTAFAMTNLLIGSRQGKEIVFEAGNRYTAKTDENGIAILHTMPPNRNQQLIALLKGFEMPLNGTDRYVRIQLKPDVVTEVTIKMQPEGTQVLSDKVYGNTVVVQQWSYNIYQLMEEFRKRFLRWF